MHCIADMRNIFAWQVLLPAQPGAGEKQGTAWEQGLWAAKVGATTVGIGALFAVTGWPHLPMLSRSASCDSRNHVHILLSSAMSRGMPGPR